MSTGSASARVHAMHARQRCFARVKQERADASTTRRLHAYACEGADENSWQSRPRHLHVSNKVLWSTTQTVSLYCSPSSHPIQNVITHRDGSLKRSDCHRHFLLLQWSPAWQHHTIYWLCGVHRLCAGRLLSVWIAMLVLVCLCLDCHEFSSAPWHA
jgi:hypothetical protein